MSLVPALLDSVESRATARRPEAQAHPNWELYRVSCRLHLLLAMRADLLIGY
jgi:hypothetical protein